MRRPSSIAVVVARGLLTAILAIFGAACGAATGQDGPDPDGAGGRPRPKRFLLVVFDQMRPEYVDLFDMKTVKKVMAAGVSYPNAYLGHMAAETVVSHNVMTTGVLPRRMGWADEVMRDVDDVLGQGAGTFHVTGSFSKEEFFALQTRSGLKKMADFLHERFPGTKVAAVGQKTTAAYGMGGPGADIIVTFGDRSFDCSSAGANHWRGPTGTNVPTYISLPPCGRFYIDSAKTRDYGTRTTDPAWMVPLDGDRMVPGADPAHQGGDTWVADVAIAIAANEDWSGLFVSFGGIDKAAHMWGGLNDTTSTDPTHLPAIARNADDQLGRLLAKLEDLGQQDETLILITADHGGNTAVHFHGTNAAGRADHNWYYGDDPDESYRKPQPRLQPLIDTGNVGFSYQDSAIRTWLVDRSPAKRRAAAQVMRGLPNVIATFFLDGDHYDLDSDRTATAMTAAERAWFAEHGLELVNTMAAPHGPDVVGLLSDDTSYGVKGDHGGAQKAVQRIPMILAGPGIARGRTPPDAFRCVDITPTVLDRLGAKPASTLDGKVIPVP